MCLLLFAHQTHPRYRLVLAANRDEFYRRPAAPLAHWTDGSAIVAGRDLEAGGTWLGLGAGGRWAAVTNYREIAAPKSSRSRGTLVIDFLTGRHSPQRYLDTVMRLCGEYAGFNLVVGDAREIHWLSNRGEGPRRLAPGIYGLSNHLLDSPWPKVVAGKSALARLTGATGPLDSEALFALLADRRVFPETRLPVTGVGPAWERILSPLFVRSPHYGTRCSSVILWEHSGQIDFVERTHPTPGGDPSTVTRHIRLPPPP